MMVMVGLFLVIDLELVQLGGARVSTRSIFNVLGAQTKNWYLNHPSQSKGLVTVEQTQACRGGADGANATTQRPCTVLYFVPCKRLRHSSPFLCAQASDHCSITQALLIRQVPVKVAHIYTLCARPLSQVSLLSYRPIVQHFPKKKKDAT
jgi:hypothetical protein